MSFLDEISNWYFYWVFSQKFQLAYSSLNPGKKRITFSFETGMKAMEQIEAWRRSG
jgi:hypothetical protein